jgi:hypothetical protein
VSARAIIGKTILYYRVLEKLGAAGSVVVGRQTGQTVRTWANVARSPGRIPRWLVLVSFRFAEAACSQRGGIIRTDWPA